MALTIVHLQGAALVGEAKGVGLDSRPFAIRLKGSVFLNLATTLTRPVRLAFVLAAGAIASGCGGGEEEKKPSTQVAARVNSVEITVHQVNAVLARTPGLSAETAPLAKREILNRLVDQQLAAEQALKKKLDRSPGVVQALEAARTEILARAYADDISRSQPKPSPDEVKRYYAEHPELFAQRRLYSLEEIIVASRDMDGTRLREQVAKSRSMREVAGWLQAEKVPFVPNQGVRAAEQLPLEMVAKLQSMKDGEIQVFDTGSRHTVVRVAVSKTEPVDEATASARIQQFLFNRRATEAVTNEMKSLKAGASIEYMGEFAGDAVAAQAKAKADAEAKAKAQTQAKAKAEAEAEARAEELARARKAAEARTQAEAKARAEALSSKSKPLQQQNVEKGISGLR